MPTLTIFFYDGQRKPFTSGNVLLYVRKFDKNLVAQYVKGQSIEIHFTNDPGPVAVVATRSGFHDCGFFVSDFSRPIHLMLVNKRESIDFAPNLYDALVSDQRSANATFINSGKDAKVAKERIGSLQTADPKSLACLLNVLEAIRWLPNAPAVIAALTTVDLRSRSIADPTGSLWKGLQQDRMFVEATTALPGLLQAGPFPFGSAPVIFHPPADTGFKEEGRFGEANLNFSLVTKNLKEKVLADIDLDYFDDKLAHIALEVIPNEASKLTRKPTLTSPVQIYAYRWMATKNCTKEMFLDGNPIPADRPRPDFDPLFTVSPG